MKKIKSLVTSTAVVIAIVIPTHSYAKVNCWNTWDPIACWLQETFGNGNMQVERGLHLPDPNSEEYKKVVVKLKNNKSFMNSKQIDTNKKTINKKALKQVCSANKLLEVIEKTGSTRKAINICFKSVRSVSNSHSAKNMKVINK